MQDGGLVSEVDDYQVWAGYGAINSTNERDYKFSDSSSRSCGIIKDDNNKSLFSVSQDKVNVSHGFEIKSEYSFPLVEQDLDGDGFIDTSRTYQVYGKGESIKLRSKKGKTFSDRSSLRWNAINAVPAGNGYKILLKGKASKSGQFKIWITNEYGIIQRRSKWKSIPQAMSANWEFIFGDVIQRDGIIGESLISPSRPEEEPLFNEQWYLKSAADQGANVQQAWSQTTESGEPIYGTGVLIAIVDDGLQHDHEDLKANYDPSASYDFIFKDNDPYPIDTKIDAHGTGAAGVAAGFGFNGIGITGAAPDASISGLRIIGKGSSEKKKARALVYSLDTVDIYSNSWGPAVWGNFLPLSPLVRSAFETGITTGRDGKGAVYIFAAGNDRINWDDNSNYDRYANSRYVIAVAGISSNGIHADYSEPGASILISAPSDGGWHKPDKKLYFETPPGLAGITTTDLSGSSGYNDGSGSLNKNKVVNLSDDNYTNDFGGTSSAVPLTSGIVALMLQANSNLSWRDVQHVLVNTASHVDSNSSGWITNGAGHYFNHDYGFGRIDADAAVTLSKSWSNVAEEVTYSGSDSPGLLIPDKGGSSLTRTISIPQDINIETIEIPIIVKHRHRNHLDIKLQSPAGTIATLAESRPKLLFSSANYDYTFSAKTFWDESSKGDWTLTVTDRKKGRIGNLEAWGLNIFGTPGINYEKTLNSSISNGKRDAITGNVGGVYATSEALESSTGLDSYLNDLDARQMRKDLRNASSWIVGLTSGSEPKCKGEGFATSANFDDIGGIADGRYQIYEMNSNDFIIDQDIRKASGSLIGRLDDQLAFAYPLVESQMGS